MVEDFARFVLKHFLRFVFLTVLSVGFLVLFITHREEIGVEKVYFLLSMCFVSGFWYSAFLIRGCLILILILPCCMMVDIALRVLPIMTITGMLLLLAGFSFGFVVRGVFYLLGKMDDAPVFQVFVLVVILLIVGYFFWCV